MIRKTDTKQIEFIDFYLPFSGRLRASNRWVHLGELMLDAVHLHTGVLALLLDLAYFFFLLAELDGDTLVLVVAMPPLVSAKDIALDMLPAVSMVMFGSRRKTSRPGGAILKSTSGVPRLSSPISMVPSCCLT